MSTDPGTPASPPTPARRRRLALTAALAAVLAALITLGVVLGGDDEATSAPSAATATPTEAPTATTAPTVVPQLPTPEPTGPTEDVDEAPPTLPEVPLDAEGAVGDVVVRLPAIEAIEGTAVGPGNITGPALRVTVRVENGTAEPVALGGVAVNLAYGPDRTPASPLDDPSRRPFATMVEPGESAEGVYVFTVPADQRDRVAIEVGYEAGAPLLLFTGPVA